MSEKWLPIKGYEGLYEVSDFGRVSRDGKILVGSEAGIGYRKVVLCRIGQKNKHAYVHRLVLETFLGPCPEGMEACHTNHDRKDNRLSNLRWGTRKENILDMVRAGRHPETRKTACPYGHPLVAHNLVVSELKRGSRKCRACNCARAFVQRTPGADFGVAASRYFERIVKDAA